MAALDRYLIKMFEAWQPRPPEVIKTSKHNVELSWIQDYHPFCFLSDFFLYRIQKKGKLPAWTIVYSGGKTAKAINNLAPAYPHKFRLQVILNAKGVSQIATEAIKYYSSEKNIYKAFPETSGIELDDDAIKTDLYTMTKETEPGYGLNTQERKHISELNSSKDITPNNVPITEFGPFKKPWLESQWSIEMWTSTESEGTSSVCFCMAVRCGYLKQVQSMLEERPGLVEIINSTNGFTPLITAVKKGNAGMVKFLLGSGADVNQPSTTGQTPLHHAVYGGYSDIVDLILKHGADFKACDINGLRAEHYAVDSGLVDMVQFIFDHGGDVHVKDGKGWTPLFRAILQGADTEVVKDLVSRGNDVTAVDNAGMSLSSAVRLARDHRGADRESIIQLIDAHYTHDKAVANFTKITKKISRLQSLLK